MAERRYIKTASGTCYRVPGSFIGTITACFSDSDAVANNFILDAGCLGFNRANNPNCIVYTPIPVPILPTPTPTPVAPVPIPVAPIPVPVAVCVAPDFTLDYNSTNGYITIGNNTTGTYYQYSSGTTFNTGAAVTGTILPGSSAIFLPATIAQYYTVRVYNQTSQCYTTKTINTQRLVIPCGESITIQVRYDGLDSARTFTTFPAGIVKTVDRHECNSARFDVLLNATSIGVANLNNAGGISGVPSCADTGPISGEHPLTRYNNFTVSASSLSSIASQNAYKRITYSLSCLVPSNRNCSPNASWGAGHCHPDVNRIIIKNQAGTVIYDDLPSGNTFSFYYGC